jgi:hypothetical protein
VIYEFDSFELRLSRGEETIHVKTGVLELRVLLIEHRDRVVRRTSWSRRSGRVAS